MIIKCISRKWMGLILIAISVSLLLSTSTPILASGGCNITNFSASPSGTVSLGTIINISGSSTCGTTKFTIDGVSKSETGQPNNSMNWNTNEGGNGNHEICFLARGDGGWENANRQCTTVNVQGSAPPTQPPPNEGRGCNISSFSVNPNGTVTPGTVVQLSGNSDCGTTKFTINGVSKSETGQPNNSLHWNTNEGGVGTHTLCFLARGNGGWENADSRCTNLSVQTSGSVNPPPVNPPPNNGGGNQNNGNQGNNDNGGSDETPQVVEPRPPISAPDPPTVYGRSSSAGNNILQITAQIGANIRSGIGTNHFIKAKAVHGAYFQYTDYQGGWYFINYSAGQGWVYGGIVEVISSSEDDSDDSNSDVVNQPHPSPGPSPYSISPPLFLGSEVGIWYDPIGDPHHYVDFTVNMCSENGWVVTGPLRPEFWGEPPKCVETIRAYFSWVDDWDSPYSADSWKLHQKQ
jgi:hypothetical protein